MTRNGLSTVCIRCSLSSLKQTQPIGRDDPALCNKWRRATILDAGELWISSPEEGQIPQASRRALELGPERACLSCRHGEMQVSHELLAKRKDEVSGC